MEWKQIEGYQSEKPAEVDTASSPTTVYLRRNITAVPNVDMDGKATEGTHWRYEETQMPQDEYKDYKVFENPIKEILEGVRQIDTQKDIDAYTMQLVEQGLL